MLQFSIPQRLSGKLNLIGLEELKEICNTVNTKNGCRWYHLCSGSVLISDKAFYCLVSCESCANFFTWPCSEQCMTVWSTPVVVLNDTLGSLPVVWLNERADDILLECWHHVCVVNMLLMPIFHNSRKGSLNLPFRYSYQKQCWDIEVGNPSWRQPREMM